MFTGIITNTTSIIGHKKTAAGLTITFEKPKGWDDLELGESIATNGVCLTVAAIRKDTYECQLVPETLAVSTFGRQLPARVNVERSLLAKDRFGGHFVQGHADGIGTVTKLDKTKGIHLTITFAADKADLVIYKGSITVDGVALTVTGVDTSILDSRQALPSPDQLNSARVDLPGEPAILRESSSVFSVAIVPFTLEHTTLDLLRVGDEVNLEFDMIGKYIARIMENRSAKSQTS